MVRINDKLVDALPSVEGFQPSDQQKEIFRLMVTGQENYQYSTAQQLAFELKVRDSIVSAAKALSRSGMEFRVFRNSKANPQFWQRTGEGGFKLLNGVKPADAIRDIYRNGRLYGTECSTAMAIVYYKAMLDVFGDELFNQLYPSIQLMNWQYLDRDLALVRLSTATELLPGDARYFKNPDVDPTHPEWQGENAFYLGGGKYYGHGVGITTGDAIIRSLNGLRKPGATRTAYLTDTVTRQNYAYLNRLASSFQRSGSLAMAMRLEELAV